MDHEALDLRKSLAVLRKRWKLVFLVTAFALIATYLATTATEPVYEAQVKLLLSPRQAVSLSGQSGSESLQLSILSERLSKTYAEILKSRTLANTVAEQLRLKVSPTQLTRRVSASPVRNTQLIAFRVEDPDPGKARLIANTYAKSFRDMVTTLDGSEQRLDAEPLIRVSVVEPAIEPTAPVRPNPLLNMILALVGGGLLGLILVFLLDYFDVSIKTAEEVTGILGAPVLGQIPTSPSKSRGGQSPIVCSHPKSKAAESFRSLRTNTQFLNFNQSLKTLMVTSPGPGEGKTSVATNLAASIAQTDSRVLLCSCDLHSPRAESLLAEPNGRGHGLTHVLTGQSDLEDSIRPTTVENLWLLPTGPLPPNPSELLGSPAMGEVLAQAAQSMDYVVIDTPPVLGLSDAAVLAPQVDGTVIVVQAARTSRTSAQEAVGVLKRLDAKMVGAVLNRAEAAGHKNVYPHYYQREQRRSMAAWARLTVAATLIAGASGLVAGLIVLLGPESPWR